MRVHAKIYCLLACLIVLTACLAPAVPQASSLAPVSISGAQNVHLIVFPSVSSVTIANTIAMARQRVLMTMYLLTDAGVIEALTTAHRNGTSVRVLLEPDPYGGVSSSTQVYDTLQQAGIDVKYSNPVYRYTHQKSIVVDQTAFVLTANLTKSGLAYNREFGIITSDPGDVGEITSVFEADWNRRTFSATNPHLVWSPDNSRAKLDGLLNLTERSLMIYAEEVQDDGQVVTMAGLAAEGKSVRLLTSPPQDNTEDANAVDLDKLQRAGVKVRYLAQPYVHAKAYIVDESTAFVGSENISTMSLEFNRELGILISDRAALTQLSSIFEDDWNHAIDR